MSSSTQRTKQVRKAILEGRTIAEIVAEYGVTKRFVETQRAILGDAVAIPDARQTQTRELVRELSEQGLSSSEIGRKLGISRTAVNRHRRQKARQSQ